MKTFIHLFCSGMLMAFLLTHSAGGAPASATYSLKLSLKGNTNGGSQNEPQITLTVINSTPHTLFFDYAPHVEPVLQFQVDYKVPGENPNLSTGWTPLKPDAKPVPKPSASDGVIVEEVSDRQKIFILPGRHDDFPASPDFSMVAPGFYRIALMMTIPHASELSGSVGAFTKNRDCKLVLHSGPLVICQTSNKFVTVAQPLEQKQREH